MDLYSNVVVEIPGQGVWRYDDFHTWIQPTPSNASMIAIGAHGAVAATFCGDGVWRWTWNGVTGAGA